MQVARLEAASRSAVTVLEKIRALTDAGEPMAAKKAEAGELDHLKALELEAKLSGEMVKRVDATVVAGRQLSPEQSLEALERMKVEFLKQLEGGEK